MDEMKRWRSRGVYFDLSNDLVWTSCEIRLIGLNENGTERSSNIKMPREALIMASAMPAASMRGA